MTALFSHDPGAVNSFQQVDLQGKGRLYIGPVNALENQEELRQQGVTHVLSVMQGAKYFPLQESHFERLAIETAVDDPECDLKSQWPRCCEFIDTALAQEGGVLIHCEAGSSRSGATLVAFLVHHLRRSSGECLILAQRTRHVVAPNEGFCAQLLAWERECIGSVLIPGGAHMHQIRPRLWLGSVEATQDWEMLQQCHITHVLTCGRGLELPLPAKVHRLLTLEIDDIDQVDMLEHLPQTSHCISRTLADDSASILVHCAAGRSRSASIVIAYLMRIEKLTYLEARNSVQKVRTIIQPNTGFSHQLEWYGQNGCPANLQDCSSGLHYRRLTQFAHLLRKYSAADVRALILSVGVEGKGCKDIRALSRASDCLDRLQNAVPMNEAAREEKRCVSRYIQAALDAL